MMKGKVVQELKRHKAALRLVITKGMLLQTGLQMENIFLGGRDKIKAIQA